MFFYLFIYSILPIDEVIYFYGIWLYYHPPPQETKVHIIYGILLSLILFAVFISVILYRSQAGDEATQTSTVTNATPTVDSVYTSITSDTDTIPTTNDVAISLIDNSFVSVYFHGQATDLNGCTELTSATGSILAKFYKTDSPDAGSSNTGCTNNSKDCIAGWWNPNEFTYQCDGGTDTVLTYNISYDFGHNFTPTDAGSANSSTDWTIKVSMTDYPLVGTAKTSSAATNTFEINTLLALDTGSQTLAFGELLLGGTSNQAVLGVENSGNVDIDLTAYSTNWSCGVGTMSASQTHYALVSGGNYATMTALLTTSSSVDITIPTATSTNAYIVPEDESSSTIYFKLRVPSTGVGGACTSSTTLTAKVNS